MEFITSSRGAPKLCFDSFTYTKKKSSKTTITWECSQRRTLECKGAVITDSPATEIRSSREHNHEKDDSHVGGLKVRKEIQLSVQANRGWPGQIIADKMASQPVEVRVAAGTTETIKRGIRRKRAGDAPNNPEKLDAIPSPLPESYTRQLVYDNDSGSDRVLVFASEDGLRLLQNAPSKTAGGCLLQAKTIHD
ncbi:uncharacterized protein LOC128241379 [Mya arenaria]|uniref:uncharacterized protein LOC128241379 n=1 Tax=Mya arenaria TaxID=6604 RepID=UPI0022E27B36|nr:uncharacterized protein LOC128241379 [Mya arenaria]